MRMRKFLRIIGIAVAIAAVFVLASCSFIQRNDDRYNNQVAIKVGDEEITLKEIMEFFDSNAANYINAGYDVQVVWDALFPQYVQQMIAVNEYKKGYTGTLYSGERSNKYDDGKYYTEDELIYLEKSLQVNILDSLESTLESEFTERGYTFSESTDSERAELTEIIIDTNLSVTARNEAYNPKELNKTLENYKLQTTTQDVDYVFTDPEDERLLAAVEKLNDRKAESDDEITPELYVEVQQSVLQKFERTLLDSGYDSVADYLESRMNLLISQQLYVDYQYQYGSKIEERDMNEELQRKLDNLVAQAVESYTLNPASFATFVTDLDSSSFIYYVPEQYAGKYGFVKNLLIPFSEDQTSQLETVLKKFGENSDTYLSVRAELATEILVTDFIDAPDADDSEKANAGFIIDGYNVVGSTFFDELLRDITPHEFVELMFRYNTDTAQHNAAYDYVIAKDEPDVTGTADTWVKEFAEVARALAKDGTVGGIGYALTSYGVHIIYYSGDVTADNFDWSMKLESPQYGAGNAAYRFYNTYYNSILSALFSREMDDLNKKYEEEGAIEYFENVMKDYLDGYGIKLHGSDT